MADAKIDKSLDEIIKERKISGRQPRGTGNRGRGALGRGGNFRRGAGNNALANRSFARRKNTGMIQKRRSVGSQNNSPNKALSASINGQWDHDLYQNRARGNGFTASRRSDSGQAKLVISNLDFGVNDQDIKGLFQEFGNIKKAAVHYDRSGRSLGTADVVFEKKPDAIRALKKYNRVSLDGRPMDIKLTAALSAVVNEIVPRLTNDGIRGGRGSRRGGRGGRGGKIQNGNRFEAKMAKSAADLDADLDAYNSKMQTD